LCVGRAPARYFTRSAGARRTRRLEVSGEFA